MIDRLVPGWRRHFFPNAGPKLWGMLLDGLLEVGFLALIALVVFWYAPYFSDYMLPKKAAIHMLAAWLLGIWLIRAAVQGSLRLRQSSLYLPLLAYLGISLLSVALAHNRLQAAEAWSMQVWLLICSLLLFHHVRQRSHVSRLLWTMLLVSLPVTCLGLLQYAGIHLIPLPSAYGNLPVSTLGNLNFVAHYLELIVVLAVGLLIASRHLGERLLSSAALLAAVGHLVLTRTRGGWLATLVGLLVLLLLRLKQSQNWGVWKSRAILATLLLALLSPAASLIVDPLNTGFGERLSGGLEELARSTVDRARSSFEGGDYTTTQRRIVWMDTLELIRGHFWLGVGPGNYQLFLPAYRSIGRHREWRELMGERREVAYRAHNEYLEIFAETGLFGVLAFLWLLATLLWTGYTAVQCQTDERLRAIACGCLAALTAALVHCLFSFNLQDPTSATHFWLLGGLLLAGGKVGTEAAEAGSPFWEWPMRTLGKPLLVLVAGLAFLIGINVGMRLLMGDYHYFRGLQHNQVDHPNRALLAFQEAIRWRSYDYRYHHMLGMMFLKTGRQAAAVETLTRSLELHPNNAPAMRLLGRALYQQQRGATAAAVLQRAIQLAPLEPDGYPLLGVVYRQQGAHQRAIEIWEQALLLTPQNPMLLNSLAVDLYHTGKLAQAIAVLEQAVLVHPRDLELQGNLGSFYLASGMAARAESLLALLVERFPEQLELRLRLAQVYMHQERRQEAWVEVEKALEQEPDNPLAQQLASALRLMQQEGER